MSDNRKSITPWMERWAEQLEDLHAYQQYARNQRINQAIDDMEYLRVMPEPTTWKDPES